MADISTGKQRGIVPFVDETTGRLPDQYLPQGVIDLQGDLEQAVTGASQSATAAKASETAAKASSTAAAEYKDAAKASETAAARSAQTATEQVASIGDSVERAAASATAAAQSASQAQSNATAANSSAQAAAASAESAQTATESAASSKDAAAQSASEASESAQAAETSKTDAASSASAAKVSETNAAASATAAETSKTDAAASASAAKVSENNAAASATAARQAVDDIDTIVEEVASDADEAVKTASQVSKRVDSLSSTITQVQGDVDLMQSKGQELVLNGGFETGTTSKWDIGNDSWSIGTDSPHSGKYYLRTTSYQLNQINSDGSLYMVPVIVGHTYRMSCWFRRKRIDSTAPVGGLRLQKSSDGVHAYDWKNSEFGSGTVDDFVYKEIEGTVDSSDIKFIHPRIAFANPGTWDVDDISIKDITDLNSVEQNLNLFKASVPQTYVPLSTYQALETRVQALEAKLPNQ